MFPVPGTQWWKEKKKTQNTQLCIVYLILKLLVIYFSSHLKSKKSLENRNLYCVFPPLNLADCGSLRSLLRRHVVGHGTRMQVDLYIWLVSSCLCLFRLAHYSVTQRLWPPIGLLFFSVSMAVSIFCRPSSRWDNRNRSACSTCPAFLVLIFT